MDATEEQALPLLDRGASASPEPRPDAAAAAAAAGRKSEDASSDGEGDAGGRAAVSRALEDDVIPETSVLGRNLGWGSAFIIIISRVIGSGIFATPGLVVKAVGSVGLALALWVVGAVIAWLAMAIFLEYGCMLPRSGGYKVYLEFTYRHPRFLASTMTAVYAVLFGFSASNCIIFGEYTLFALGVEPTPFAQKGLAVGLITAVTVLHGCFRRTGIFLQNLLGWLKIGLVIFMVITSVVVVVFRGIAWSPPAAAERSLAGGWDSLWAGSVWNLEVMTTALFKVWYSYAGFDSMNNVLNEVKDPVRTLRSAAPAALMTACVLYLFVNIAYLLVIPLDEIKNSGELIAGLFFQRTFGAALGSIILPLVVALSAAGNVLVVTFSLARLNQEIARQGFLPFADVLSSSRPFNSPMGGLAVHWLPSVLVLTLPPSDAAYSFILDVDGYPTQLIAIALAGGLIWLRFKRPDLARPYKAWIPGVILRIVLALVLLAAPFFPSATAPGNGMFHAMYAVVGTGVFVVGAMYWYLWTVLLPRWRHYSLEEKEEILADGTTVTSLIRVPVS